MLFNSIEFLLFLPSVFFLYWLVLNKNIRLQNSLLLVSSYVFYGWWDWRFLFLILLSSILDFFVGLRIHEALNQIHRKRYLFLSIFFNLSLLGFFKYFNFFIDSWINLLNSLGYNKSMWTLNVILPVGISFYTFQTMSYSLDIYFKKLKPTKDFITFASFVSFFPQLVAGPIERASNLLPQILKPRLFDFNQAVAGLRLILWGMFKKIVIADSLAPLVDAIFLNYSNLNGGLLILGLLYFSFQIYCDFSGYSDIAIGTAKLFGIELMSNFKFPYFSRNIGEFWRRWHISLSSWFRDYLYIPLGGSSMSKSKTVRNIFVIFLVSGFWHGANWTFLMWGLAHSFLYLPLFIFGTNRQHITQIVAKNKLLPSIKELLQIGTTFLSISLTWVFFRSETVNDAFHYLYRCFFRIEIPTTYLEGVYFILILVVLDWSIRKNERLSFKITKYDYVFNPLMLLAILNFVNQTGNEFIYFQF